MDRHSDPERHYPGRSIWLLVSGAAWTLWALALTWFVLHLAYVAVSPHRCPPYIGDDSSAGDAGWQWLPPGVTCTYYADGEGGAPLVVWTPDLSLGLLAVLIVVMPLAVLASRRTSRTA
jgi:hypothetical protein